MALHMWTNDHEWVIAESEDDAWAVWEAHIGEKRADYQASMEWHKCDPTKPFTFVDVDEDPPVKTTKTRAEWIAEHGRGYFASEDY